MSPLEELLERYRRHLVVERALSSSTVNNRVREARSFLAAQADGGELETRKTMYLGGEE